MKKELLKESNFEWIRIFLCIVPFFVPSWAKVTYDEAKFRIFDKEKNFEVEIFKSLQTTKNFFAHPIVKNAVLVGLLIGLLDPYLAAITSVIFVMQALLASESDWKGTFSKTIAHETKREIAVSAVRWMEATITTIEGKYHLMSENNTDMESRKRIASTIHTELDKMLNLFGHKDSIFKRYPLVGTPLLLQLAQLIACLDPMAKILIKEEAKSPDLLCKTRNILLEYRVRTVDARLERLHVFLTDIRFQIQRNESSDLPKFKYQAMSTPYNQYGYSISIPANVNCEKGCDNIPYCLADDFGEEYTIPPWSCVRDYALLLRHRIDELFPVDLLSSLCVDPPATTGFGWLTMKLRYIRATRKWDGLLCDFFTECDPFVKLFIDGKLELQTETTTNECCYDLDTYYISQKISKSAWIKIELLDEDLSNSSELVLSTEGNVDSFLREGYRSITYLLDNKRTEMGRTIRERVPDENYIDTISFWKDEYKYK